MRFPTRGGNAVDVDFSPQFLFRRAGDVVQIVFVGRADDKHVDVARHRAGLVVIASRPRTVDERLIDTGHAFEQLGEYRRGSECERQKLTQHGSDHGLGVGLQQAKISASSGHDQAGVAETIRLAADGRLRNTKPVRQLGGRVLLLGM